MHTPTKLENHAHTRIRTRQSTSSAVPGNMGENQRVRSDEQSLTVSPNSLPLTEFLDAHAAHESDGLPRLLRRGDLEAQVLHDRQDLRRGLYMYGMGRARLPRWRR